MKSSKVLLVSALCVLIVVAGLSAKRKILDPGHQMKESARQVNELSGSLKSGDIIFQSIPSGQGKAIEMATHSVYSHCGMIFNEGDNIYVLEAVQPVKKTPLARWMARGYGGHYVIKRLKNAEQVLTDSTIEKMKTVGSSFKGKNYDIYFGWSDDKIYCSELVWKVYHRATGLEIGKLQQLKDFDLSSPVVKHVLKERYGSDVPLNDTVIAPVNIFNSELLETVVSK